jgi:hypothetical protein
MTGSHGGRIVLRNVQVTDTVEIITHYSNTRELLSDVRRTVDAVTTMVVEDDRG